MTSTLKRTGVSSYVAMLVAITVPTVSGDYSRKETRIMVPKVYYRC